jgi:hypothetical protein
MEPSAQFALLQKLYRVVREPVGVILKKLPLPPSVVP